jgi:retron-type reverse transcriptase
MKFQLDNRLCWNYIYKQIDLYKTAICLYTKPLFSWRKALSTSTDAKNLYDFARHGLDNLDSIHQQLASKQFCFRPGIASHHNFNGKKRTLYIFPWEERLVDLMLYRTLTEKCRSLFAPESYAYRGRGFGVDRCQQHIAALIKHEKEPLYVIKRDISNYFASINHPILLEMLAEIVHPNDYLFKLLTERIRFNYTEKDNIASATLGVPFGTAIACFFANLYLTKLDRKLTTLTPLRYFRYADDFLIVTPSREVALAACQIFADEISFLKLHSKPSHALNFIFSEVQCSDAQFEWTRKFRHLGLEFRANGTIGLSRDKTRKISNLFRYSFRRNNTKLMRITSPVKRAQFAIDLACKVIDYGIRNVALIDYYLKHSDDEKQWQQLDRWLAEEVLAIAFGNGHKKGNFAKLSFEALRNMGLPSLVHRRRLIRHGHIDSPFFIWRSRHLERDPKGAAVKPQIHAIHAKTEVFSPFPAAAIIVSS